MLKPVPISALLFSLTQAGALPAAEPIAVSEPNKSAVLNAPVTVDWNFHAQSTFVGQAHSTFPAPVSGPNSLHNQMEFKRTVSLDLMLGRRLWRGAEFYVDGMMWQGYGLSDATGAAGFPNGEAFRLGAQIPNVSFSRVFLRQTIGLGGEQETVADDAQQLAGTRDSSRLTFTVGKLSAKDIFDRNAYANDPRTQFLNWSLMANGAWDFPADALGYTSGAAVEWNESNWAARAGTFLVPRYANGTSMDKSFTRSWSTVFELEHRHTLADRPGAVRWLTFLTQSQMGSYAETVANPALGGNILATRAWRKKFGFGLNAEQEIVPDLGGFLRVGWNDGQNQTWMFTDVDRTVSAGLSLKGRAWGRAEDTLGVAGVVNGISLDHRRFLAVGGTGITVGDGGLNYAPEILTEVYYDARLPWRTHAMLDFQFVTNPAYNRDRGPVPIVGARLHWEF